MAAVSASKRRVYTGVGCKSAGTRELSSREFPQITDMSCGTRSRLARTSRLREDTQCK